MPVDSNPKNGKSSPARRIGEDLHRIRLLLPCALAAMLLLRWAALRGRPERMAELPLSPITQWAGIHTANSIVFGLAPNGVDLVAHSRSITDGRERLLLRHDSTDTEAGAFIAGPYLYYVNVWYRNVPLGMGPGRKLHAMNNGLSMPDLRGMLGSRSAHPGAPQALGLLSRSGRSLFASQRSKTTLHRVPLAGGAPRTISLDTSRADPIFYNLSVLGEHIFWIRRRPLAPAESTRYAKRDGTMPPAYFEMMVSPGEGGSARRLYSGVFETARLFSSTQGVYLRVVRPDFLAGQTITDVVYVSSDTLQTSVIKDCLFEPASPPVECRGKVYWINERYTSPLLGGFNDAVRRDLVCANPDGTAQRVVLNLMDGGKATVRLTRLFSYGGRLYGVLFEAREERGADAVFRAFLCGIEPGSEPIVRKLTSLPRRSWDRGVFERGYYYFVVTETQDSILDWSTDGPPQPEKFYLYRWKLPDAGSS